MLALMGDLTDEKDWQEYVIDDSYTNHWRNHQLSQDGISSRMLDWV